MTNHTQITLAIAGLAVASLAGCSSGSSSDAASSTPAETSPAASSSAPSESPSGDASATTSQPACDETAILAALPESSKMIKYTCNTAGVEYWAAAEVDPGPTVFFLKWTGDTWDPMMSDDVCGTASAGLPEDILAYCEDAS